MPITISGTTGVAGVDGSASTPAIQGTDTNSGIYFSGNQIGLSTDAGGALLTVDSNSNITFPAGVVMSSPFAMKNKIINGAMEIDVRNSGAAVTPTANAYTLDRWLANITVASKYSVQRSTTAPSNFTNSALITSTSAYSVVAGDYETFQQRIEAFNMSDVGWGTAAAKNVVLSFWVRSSLTGTFGGSLYFPATTTRTYPFSYVINSANTWEYKTISIPGDTTSNTAPTTNNIYVVVQWALGVGSTYTTSTSGWQNGNYAAPTGCINLIATNAATLYLTGVQLEVGTIATPFERRLYPQELAMCQRYTYRYSADGSIDSYSPFGIGRYYNTNLAQLFVKFPVTMRYPPGTLTVGGNIVVNDTGFGSAAWTSIALNERAYDGATVIGGTTTGVTAGNATTFYSDNTSNAYLIFDAEL